MIQCPVHNRVAVGLLPCSSSRSAAHFAVILLRNGEHEREGVSLITGRDLQTQRFGTSGRRREHQHQFGLFPRSDNQCQVFRHHNEAIVGRSVVRLRGVSRVNGFKLNWPSVLFTTLNAQR